MKNLFGKGIVLSGFAVVTAISSVATAQAPAAPHAATHDEMQGRVGVGYLGRRSMSVGTLANELQAPVVGVRYWINHQIGIDAGLGLAMSSGSSEVKTPVASVKTDSPSETAFILHGGVPISLMARKHYSFQIVPEMNLGIGSGSEKTGAGEDIDSSGFHLDLGARAGAEIHFGFIGIPELSLQATVGLGLASDSVSVDRPDNQMMAGGTRTETSASRFFLGTSVNSAPWAIFTNSVGALYYF